eukprot:CAMPEP_0183534988 /NCGR_PEP_ID=MMETSP0371-20130417/27248_1 /TAXON_ID=268820 /ORGANISM="Peridinium aciculiferum, Strain PAER-2" /LENGTH=279 /DNA_ID=CAMNT_0025735401 /DNA_START=80 /DNA_END=919 /DNA_ORIENTATION=+
MVLQMCSNTAASVCMPSGRRQLQLADFPQSSTGNRRARLSALPCRAMPRESSSVETFRSPFRRAALHAALAAAFGFGGLCVRSVRAEGRSGAAQTSRLSIEQRDAAAAELYGLCTKEGLRPSGSGWTKSEKAQAETLVDALSNANLPWRRSDLVGTWKVAYLQGDLDRRIPFPDLPFNESYQVFGESSVVNIGEILGPSLAVRVSGVLAEEDPQDLVSPKRFRANINSGTLDIGQGSLQVPLPITGLGIFDGVYLDDRLRIGLNLNGTGARVVQVKIAP